MNTKKYTYLLAHPQEIKKEDLKELETVIQRYPYFQSARALRLKELKNNNSFLYNEALKVTAAYTTDRDILFEYITSQNFIQNEISEAIQQHDEHVLTLDVKSEDVSEEVSLALDRQMKEELKKAEAILNPNLFQRKLESIKEIVETPAEKKEATVQPDAPLEFKKEDTHSFSEWLKLTKAQPIDRSSEEKTAKENTSDKERKFELIEKFIQQNPKLQPASEAAPRKDLAEPFTQPADALMTETLAKVYMQQKNYLKAIQAYKILILKYPEKSGFFADQIRAIKKLINTEEQ
ncbi:hypothetical protein [Altibacter sp.]|uniref:hypothetical protein n=1 Tax=Altibacter sp. TaxID=2024823 RepID=UPI00258A11FE|nr:hypothetical protein [Altibacter sp.]MCW9038477.1 hypothetical protein [Altibacter sp.]